jgi:hypothetical protein
MCRRTSRPFRYERLCCAEQQVDAFVGLQLGKCPDVEGCRGLPGPASPTRSGFPECRLRMQATVRGKRSRSAISTSSASWVLERQSSSEAPPATQLVIVKHDKVSSAACCDKAGQQGLASLMDDGVDVPQPEPEQVPPRPW